MLDQLTDIAYPAQTWVSGTGLLYVGSLWYSLVATRSTIILSNCGNQLWVGHSGVTSISLWLPVVLLGLPLACVSTTIGSVGPGVHRPLCIDDQVFLGETVC